MQGGDEILNEKEEVATLILHYVVMCVTGFSGNIISDWRFSQ